MLFTVKLGIPLNDFDQPAMSADISFDCPLRIEGTDGKVPSFQKRAKITPVPWAFFLIQILSGVGSVMISLEL